MNHFFLRDGKFGLTDHYIMHTLHRLEAMVVSYQFADVKEKILLTSEVLIKEHP